MTKSHVSRKLIDDDKARVIRLQASLVRDEGFFLAGGVGLALHLGHRVSADLDWFTANRFDPSALQLRLESLAESPTQFLREKVKADLVRGVQQWEHGRAKRGRLP
jgi:hypothetical protein